MTVEPEFPHSLIEFEEQFATEEQCRDHLYRMRFPDGFRCPKCSKTGFWWTARQLLHCKGCGHQASLRAGTIMEQSKKPLRLWYRAFFLVAFQKQGISAKNLQAQLGFGSYQTAWTWLHKIRRAMRRPHRKGLAEVVEVDEALYGGVAPGAPGRTPGAKQLVVVGAEVVGLRGIGRIRMEPIPDASSESLQQFISANVKPGAAIWTDGWKPYKGAAKNYLHVPVTGALTSAKVLPRVHLIVSHCWRWLLGTHQGRVSRRHLQWYLDEFVFRFNRRTSRSRGKVFYRLLQQAISHQATTYSELVGKSSKSVTVPALT